jgi:subtilisin family serine protease
VPEESKKKPAPAQVVPRDDQYLIAPVPADLLPMGVEPFNVDVLKERLEADPEVDLVRTIAPRGMVSAMSAGAPGAQEVMVAQMPEGHAKALEGIPHLIVEPDVPLLYQDPIPEPVGPTLRDPGTLTPFSAELKLTIVVQGEDGTPLPEAQVYVFGRLWPAQGTTNKNGKVTLTLFGEQPDTLVGLYVDPKSEYWSVYVQRPLLSEGEEHLVKLPPLSAQFPGFPETEMLGWGAKAMKVDALPPTYRGQGVKVGIVDSGVAGGHIDLGQARRGLDLTAEPPNPETWDTDVIGHGSHCSGVIAAAANERGIVGIAPEAEVNMYKIFPGGRASSLIEALQHCIDDQVDVINLSLGSDERSELVDHKIAMAKEAGIACIVAAGNSNGPVQFPAGSAQVIAVAAIGKQGEYPPTSYQATEPWPGGKVSPEGYFSAKFTCFGPEVDVCAPGVGIVSSVPADSWTAMDGTSMATPHVTGLAALILAHHEDFKSSYSARNGARVDRLFEIIKASAEALDLGDPLRTGAGLPNAVNAFAQVAAAAPAPAAAAPVAAASPGLAHLGQLVEAANLKAATSPPPNAGLPAPAAAQPAAAVPTTSAQPAVATGTTGAFGQLRELMEEAKLVSPQGVTPVPAASPGPDPTAQQRVEALRELISHAGI